MKIQENISLGDFTTLKIGGPAKYFAIAKNEADLRELFSFARSRRLPIFVLGGGSNLLVSDHGFTGLVIKIEIKGIKFTDEGEVILEVGAGEIWDEVVSLSIVRNLSGLESLSGIPGTVGGAVVQNAGAYGAEIKDCLLSVEGLNLENGKKFTLGQRDCQYGYRTSIFKLNKKFVITTAKFILNKKNIVNIDYASLKAKLANEKEINPLKIRTAVLEIRAEKLPDWHKIGTAGSFFKNPVVTAEKYADLKVKYPDLPGFPEEKNKVKLSLAWVLDNICHLKGFALGPVALYEKQPLVLVNFGGATEKELNNLVLYIKKEIKNKLEINLEEEVEKIY